MKAEETAKWQEDDGGNDRHHHYHCNRAHLLLCLFEEEDDNISNKHENCEESAPKKADKETVVTFSDAVSHHATVMIEHLNTVLAGGTVAGPRRTVDPACLAKFILYILPFQEIFKLDWVRSEEGSSGDDSGVGARSEKEK